MFSYLSSWVFRCSICLPTSWVYSPAPERCSLDHEGVLRSSLEWFVASRKSRCESDLLWERNSSKRLAHHLHLMSVHVHALLLFDRGKHLLMGFCHSAKQQHLAIQLQPCPVPVWKSNIAIIAQIFISLHQQPKIISNGTLYSVLFCKCLAKHLSNGDLDDGLLKVVKICPVPSRKALLAMAAVILRPAVVGSQAEILRALKLVLLSI